MRHALVLLLAALLLVPVTARADDRAKAFFQAGAQAYDAGRFAAAVQAFEEAYRLAPVPAILFSMAQAERKQFFVSRSREFLDRAVSHYRSYLQAQGATRRAEAADALAELEGQLARLAPVAAPAPAKPQTTARLMVTTQAAGAQVAVDAQAPVPAPFIDDLAPGRHKVRVEAEGFHPEEREVELALGSPTGLDLVLKERSGTLRLSGEEGADVYVDGRRVGETPLPGPIELSPGRHAVVLVRRGHEPFTRELQLGRGEAVTLEPRLSRTWQRVGSYVVLGSGVLVALGGVTCSVIALNREQVAQKVLEQQARENITGRQLQDYNLALRQRDQWRSSAQTTSGIAAGLLVIGGLVYWLDQPRVSSQGSEVTLSPLLVPGGVGMAAGGRF